MLRQSFKFRDRLNGEVVPDFTPCVPVSDVFVSLVPAGEHPSHRVVECKSRVRATATRAVSIYPENVSLDVAAVRLALEVSLVLLLGVMPRWSCVRDISEVERRVLACQHRTCKGVVARSDVESLRLRK